MRNNAEKLFERLRFDDESALQTINELSLLQCSEDNETRRGEPADLCLLSYLLFMF